MSNETSSISITDFSPGIYQTRYESSVGSSRQGGVPRGAASVENTYRCVGNADGSLGPLPRRTAGVLTTPIRGTNGVPANYAALEMFITDMLVDNGAYPAANETPTSEDTYVYLSQAFWYDSAGASTYLLYNAVTYFRLFDGTVNDIYLNRTTATHPKVGIPAGLLARGSTTWSTATLPYQPDGVFPVVFHSFSFPRSAVGIVLNSGGGAFVAGDTAIRRGTNVATYQAPTFAKYNTMVWPAISAVAPGQSELVASACLWDPSFVSSNAGTAIKHLVFHQGRVVTVQAQAFSFGNVIATRFHYREEITYQSYYNVYKADSPGYIIPGEESSNGYGAVASMNAGELVLIRQDGGAVVIRGDLAFPSQIQSLPMVEGTYGVACIPAVTPLGLVYLSRNGVFAWNGQDTSVKLSANIDGDFTDPSPNIPYFGPRGRLAWWHPWVCLPNNYLFDSRTNALWRLDNPADHTVYTLYDTDGNNRLFAAKYKVTNTDTIPWDTYSQDTLASDYSWQSLPIVDEVPTDDRWDSYSSVTLTTERATGGTPTVTVTVTGLDERGNTTSTGTATFTLNTSSVNGPSTMNVNLDRNVKARIVQVRIVANSGSASVAAPLVRAMVLNRRDGHRKTSDLSVKGR